jgi:hypothetical protein
VSAAADTRWRHAARLAGVAALILLGAVWVAWLGFRPQVMGDYPRLFAPSMNALLAGHVGVFFANLPTDGAGGSVLLRAPFALIGKELVGGQHAIFRFGALGCLLISVGPALWLAREMRLAGRSALARGVLIAVFLLTPAVLGAILYGHPEEPLGASLCIAAVLLAASGRCGLAGVILSLAMINKPWAALAIPPVLLAAPAGRLRLLAYSGAIAGAWIAAAYIGSPPNFKDTILGASNASVAHPIDLWWPLAKLKLAPGVTPHYVPPRLIADHGRQLVAVAAVVLVAPLVHRRTRGRVAGKAGAAGAAGVAAARPGADQALALLALLFLLRCLLDPCNHDYYQVPFVLALAAWEARTRGMPLLALLSLGGFWAVFHPLAGTGSLTLQFLGYLAVALPLAALLGAVVLGRRLGIVQPHDRHRLSRGLSRGLAS